MSSSVGARPMRARRRARSVRALVDNEWQSTVVLDPVFRHRRRHALQASIDDTRQNNNSSNISHYN